MSTSISLHAVGHHLQKEAISAAPDEKDAYARSAFNRYYYSVFLNARSLLQSLDPSWASSMKHASYPGFLNGTVRPILISERQKAIKNGNTDLVRRIESAKRAVEALARIMETANSVRVAADYEHDESVSFGGNHRFSIKSVDISVAHDWEGETRMLCKTVRKVWHEIHA